MSDALPMGQVSPDCRYPTSPSEQKKSNFVKNDIMAIPLALYVLNHSIYMQSGLVVCWHFPPWDFAMPRISSMANFFIEMSVPYRSRL